MLLTSKIQSLTGWRNLQFCLFFLCILLAQTVFAQPGSVTRTIPLSVSETGAGAVVAWTNPGNSILEDGISASVTLGGGSTKKSKILNITNFGFASGPLAGQIPVGATISGIEVEILEKATGAIKDQTVKLIKSGTPAGATRNQSATWPTTFTYVSHGDVNDLWGTTWTVANITASNFGVQVQVSNKQKNNSTAEVDNVRITVYYNLNVYYSKSTGNLTSVTTWGTNANGTGTSPTNFTTAGQIFNVVNRSSVTLNADLTVSGLLSKIVVGDGSTATNLIVPSTAVLNSTIDVSTLSTLTIENTTLPTFGALEVGSTVNYNAAGPQSVQEADYGNLSISGGNTKTLLGGANLSTYVAGQLSIAASTTFSLGYPVRVDGDIVNNGATTGIGEISQTGDVAATISGSGSFRALVIDNNLGDPTTDVTLSGTFTVSNYFRFLTGKVQNGTSLIPGNGCTIEVMDGIIKSTITSTNSYNLLYTGVSKSSSYETSGSGLEDITIDLNSSSYTVTLAGNVTAKGNVLISTGSLDAASYTLTVGKNLTCNSNFIAGTSTVTFNTNVNSIVSGTNYPSFYNLAINKGSAYTLDITNTTVSNNITLTSGQVNLSNYTLRIGNAISTTGGLISAANGTLVMYKTGTVQSISGSCFLSGKIGNLLCSNNIGINISSTLSDSLKIVTSIGFSGVSNSTINTGNNLVLLSSASSTAAVSELANGNAITGKAVVERYIGTSRKWRLLSVPVDDATLTFKQSWQENNVANGNSKPGYGMMITDNLPNWASNGFDAQSPGGPSVKTYNSPTGAFDGITSTSATIKTSGGYMCFIRGDRSATSSNAVVAPTVLRAKGNLYTGNKTVVVPANSFAVVGNPYASRIDLRRVTTSNIQPFFYIWDANLTTGLGLGGYQTCFFTGTDYLLVPGGGSYGVTNNYIESGQAFFVKSYNGAGSVSFKESDKSTGSSPINFTSGDPQYLKIDLYQDNGNSQILLDGVLAAYGPGLSNSVDHSDAIKLKNTSENVALKRSDSLLAIESRPDIMGKDSLYLDLSQVRVQSYKWQIDCHNMDMPGRTGKIIDKYTGQITTLNLGSINTFSFTIVNIPGSYARDRFLIVFDQEASVIPVRLLSFNASRKNSQSVNLDWKVEAESGISRYIVEKSLDGVNFENAGSVNARNNSSMPGAYFLADNSANQPKIFYRLRTIYIDQHIDLSEIIQVVSNKTTGKNSFVITLSRAKLTLRTERSMPDSFTVKIRTIQGQLLQTHVFHGNGGETKFECTLLSTLSSGMYTVSVDGQGDIFFSQLLRLL